MNTTAAAPLRSSARRGGLLAVVAVAVLATAAGCTDEDRRELGGQDAQDSLQGRIEQLVEDEGLELDGDLTCTADITAESVVTSACDGTTTSGATVSGTFDGTADVSDGAETCRARLVVLLDDAAVLDEPDVDCFDVG